MTPYTIIASKNKGKIKEIKMLLEDLEIALSSLYDYPEFSPVVEDGETFFDNALKKARTVSELTGFWVIADDSGIEVDALDGRPGVYSARYAGENATDKQNSDKLLEEMKDVPDGERGAQFRAVIVYADKKDFHSFEGIVRGGLARERSGKSGFGYDPIFIPDGYDKTFAELGQEIKNSMSHRAAALNKLKEFLKDKML